MDNTPLLYGIGMACPQTPPPRAPALAKIQLKEQQLLRWMPMAVPSR